MYPGIQMACAAITALSISGQATGRFCFEGFLSTAKKSRREHLESLKKEQLVGSFVEDHGALLFFQALQMLPSAFLCGGKEALEAEAARLPSTILLPQIRQATAHCCNNPTAATFCAAWQ